MASVLKDYVHCPICYELFEGELHEPYALQCLHTLCKQCVDRVSSTAKFKCPQCKTVCDKDSTKKDFRTKSLVDDYLKEKAKIDAARDITSKAVLKCGMCDATGKPLKSRCIECQLYLCSDCERRHKKIPALKNHTVESLTSVAKNLEAGIKKTMLEFEKVKQATGQGKCLIQAEYGKIDKSSEEAVRKINICRKKQHKDIDTYHDNLIKTVKDEKTKLQDKLALREVQIQTTLREVQSRVSHLGDLLKKKDKSKILGPGETANKRVKEDIQNLHKEMADLLKQKAKFTVEVQESKITLDAKNSTSLSISSNVCDATNAEDSMHKSTEMSTNEIQQHGVSETAVPLQTSITAKLEYTTLEKSIQVTGSGRRLNIVGNEIWCLTREALHIFDLQGVLVNSIFWEISDEWASSVVPSPIDENHILVSFYHSGVQVLNKEGRQLDVLCQGEFSDVAIYENDLYALEWEEKRVLVFEFSGNSWREIGYIQLNYEEGHSCDKVHIANDMMFVSSWFNNAVYVFTLEGDLLDSHGQVQSDEDTIPQIEGPKLCTVDSEGSILLSDSNNGKLKWCSISSNFYDISFSQAVGQPEDAIINSEDNSLWMLTYSGGYKLLKFT